ncbi:CxxH/CxxC protein [Bacillus sp. JJ1122]|uniref:CxxH/CxxC protein n=1 Tax=Bacillus sp. JJ1122 TaxID=3122951 RepID=UPI003F68B57B
MKGFGKMKYCCSEHVELALDEAVDEYETAPQLEKLEAVENSGFSCGYCGQPAVYIVANE